MPPMVRVGGSAAEVANGGPMLIVFVPAIRTPFVSRLIGTPEIQTADSPFLIVSPSTITAVGNWSGRTGDEVIFTVVRGPGELSETGTMDGIDEGSEGSATVQVARSP